MKKTVLEMFFLHDHNPCVDLQVPRFVYRHCSAISFHKIKRLAEKLRANPNKIFIAAFGQLMASYVKTDCINIVKRINSRDISMWECRVSHNLFNKNLEQVALKTKSKKQFSAIETLAVKFEVKIVKHKILFSYYYPEDFLSEIFSSQMVYDFEKLLRELFKQHEI